MLPTVWCRGRNPAASFFISFSYGPEIKPAGDDPAGYFFVCIGGGRMGVKAFYKTTLCKVAKRNKRNRNGGGIYGRPDGQFGFGAAKSARWPGDLETWRLGHQLGRGRGRLVRGLRSAPVRLQRLLKNTRLLSSDKQCRRKKAANSKSFRPTARRVINAQDLNCVVLYPIRNNERRSWNHQLSRSGNTARTSHLGVLGKKCFYVVQDVKDDALCSRWIVLGNKGAQRSKVVDRLGRPDWRHDVEGLGAGRSLSRPQEPTQSLTCWCDIPLP